MSTVNVRLSYHGLYVLECFDVMQCMCWNIFQYWFTYNNVVKRVIYVIICRDYKSFANTSYCAFPDPLIWCNVRHINLVRSRIWRKFSHAAKQE